MKKLIFLVILCMGTSCALFSQEAQNSAPIVTIEEIVEEEVDETSFFPADFHLFGLSVDNQITTLNRLLNRKGEKTAVAYFLSLNKNDNKKALEVLSKNGNEALRLVILENLPIKVFFNLLSSVFDEIGGQAISHWSYKSEEKLETSYMTPSVRAQQYINFFMNYDASVERDVPRGDTMLKSMFTKTITVDNEEVLKSRGQKIAQVLNKMDGNRVIELLYGRPDTRFIGEKDRIVFEGGESKFSLQINNSKYVYQRQEMKSSGHHSQKAEWVSKDENAYKQNTSASRVSSKSINYIIPYLEPKLITAIFVHETKEDKDALVPLINSIGCKKLFNELVKYFEVSIKDKVFELCNNDDSLFDMLGLPSEDPLPAIGSGQEDKKQIAAEPHQENKDL